MSELQHYTVDQGVQFLLPYGAVVVVSGSGFVLHGPALRSRIKLRVAKQSLGPFNYDTYVELIATGDSELQVFDLRSISQAELDTLVTLAVGTRATVADGGTRTQKYWDGTDWVTSSGGGEGADGEDAGRVLDETISSETDNITLAGATAALVTINRPGANTVTLVTRAVDATLEVRRPYLVRATGAGATTFVASGSAVIVKEAGKAAALAGAHVPATAMLVDDSTWWLFGGLDSE